MGLSISFNLGRLRLLLSSDVEVNPGPVRRCLRNCSILYCNIRGLHGNLSDLAVAAGSCDVLFCSETLVSSRRHISELRLPDFGKPMQILRGESDRSRGFAVYVRAGFSAYRQTKFECNCCELMVVRISGALSNTYVFGVYRNPDLDNHIYDCLLTAMANIQAADSRASFVFVGDVNAHHLEWLGSSRTTEHGVAAYDFASLSGCTQMVSGPTHVAGGTLDLVLTDVPDLVSVDVGSPIGSSDHSALQVKLSLNQTPSHTVVEREVFLKNSVNWDLVRGDVLGMDWRYILGSDCPASSLNRVLSGIVVARVPTRTLRINSKNRPWFDNDCLLASRDKQEAYKRWSSNRTAENWDRYVDNRRVANYKYSLAQDSFNARCRETLSSSVSSHKWWSTLKSAVFGVESSIPPLLGTGGGLVCSPEEKATLLNAHFDSKQCRDQFDPPQFCYPAPKLCSVAFRSRMVEKLLLDLDSYGGSDPYDMFPLFFKKTAREIAPKLSMVFRGLLRSGSFPVFWKVADVVPVPKGAPSAQVANYRPISITPVLSKVFERVIAVKFGWYLESGSILPNNQFAYRRNLGTCDALLTVSHHLQSALDNGMEARLVQLDFSAAFDRVSHAGLLHKLQAIGVGGLLLSVFCQFLHGRKQRVRVDGSCSSYIDLVSGVPQGSVLGPLLFIVYTSDLFNMVSNHLVGYADDTTLYAVIPNASKRPDVTASLNRDLESIDNWCCQWQMKLNATKTKTLLVSRSRTSQPVHGDLILGGCSLSVSDSLKILGIRFDSKLTFEAHIRDVVASASRSLGIMRRANAIFGSADVLKCCFLSYVLSGLEYCAPVWASSAVSHLRLLDRIVHRAEQLCGVQLCCLDLRRRVGCLSLLYRIFNSNCHPLKQFLLPHVATRATRSGLASHNNRLVVPRCKTVQFSRSFVPFSVQLWNNLPADVFECCSLSGFKARVNSFLKSC